MLGPQRLFQSRVFGTNLLPRVGGGSQGSVHSFVFERIQQQIGFVQNIQRSSSTLIRHLTALPVIRHEQIHDRRSGPEFDRQMQGQFTKLRQRFHCGRIGPHQLRQKRRRTLSARRLVQGQALPQRPIEGRIDGARRNNPHGCLFRIRH
jgi:hypothetical protein